MMDLSKNLTLEECLVTSTGIANKAPFEAKIRLFYLAQFIFQPTRDKFGPIKVTSGYRSRSVNRAVGGQLGSQHSLGEALDLVPLESEIDAVFDWMVHNIVSYGQLISEKDKDNAWIHVSLPRHSKPNMVALTYDGVRYDKYTG